MTGAVVNMAADTRDPESPTSRVNASLGMALFIGSWSMAFGTLFLSYFILRHRQGVWPPEGVQLPSFTLAALGTGILLASSVLLHGAMTRLAAGRPGVALRWNAALALGLVFAGLQSWLWVGLMSAGRLPESGVYESLFYGLTWFHAAHVACGLLGLIWVSRGLATGRCSTLRTIVPGNIAVFWHFVDVVWIALFLSFFVY